MSKEVSTIEIVNFMSPLKERLVQGCDHISHWYTLTVTELNLLILIMRRSNILHEVFFTCILVWLIVHMYHGLAWYNVQLESFLVQVFIELHVYIDKYM